MADEEISSLLLRVGVDFASLEEFVAAMPVVVDVAAAVGQQLDALQIGSPEVFREKGQALSRALVAGFQAEALGLTFGNANLASIITERVFGDPAALGAVSQRYVQDVQKVLDSVRLQLPQLSAPLVSQQSLNSLGAVGSLAGQSRRELDGMASSLDQVLARMAALANVQVPKTVLRRTPEGEVEFTPSARRAAEAVGSPALVPRLIARTGPRGSDTTQLAFAESNRVNAQALRDTLALQQQDAQQQQAALAQRIRSQILGAAAVQRQPAQLNLVDEAPRLRADQARLALQRAEESAALARVRASLAAQQPALPAGTGAAAFAVDRAGDARAARQLVRLNEIAARRDLDLVDNSDSFALRQRDSGPRLTSFDRSASPAVVGEFLRSTNEAILRSLDLRAKRDGQTANTPDLSPEALSNALGSAAFGQLINGRGLGPQQRLALSEEQRDALGDTNAPRPTGRLFPPALIDRAQAIRELSDPNARGAFAIAPVSRFDRPAITAGSPADPRLAPDIVRSRADQLAREARAAADARARASIPVDLGLPTLRDGLVSLVTNVAGGLPGAAPLTRGPRPDGPAFGAPDAAGVTRAQALVDQLTAAGATATQLAPFQQALQAAQAQAARATVATTEAERQLGASSRALAGARAASSRVIAAGPQGVSVTTLGEASANRLPIPTISESENARRRQVLQEQAARARQQAFEDERARQRLRGDDPQFGARPGTSPNQEDGASRFRREQRARRFPNESDVGFGGGRGGPPLGGSAAAAADDPRGPSGLGNLLAGARRGFFGPSDGDGADFFGRSIGSALRFSLVYGAAYSALRLVTTGFGEGVRGAIEFETALTDLNIATERTGRANEALAFDLANISSGRGFSSGEGVAAGARAIGLFGATDSSAVDQAAIANVSTDVATKIAFLSGQTIEQVQTQLAGITRSFGVDPLNQEQIFDVASFVGKRSGRPAGELLQSLGQIGSLGGDAGFSLEQTAAIIARLTSTTGQTPQAVSGFLSQVLSRADDPRLQQRLRAVGVDTQGTTLAQQVEQLSTLDLEQSQKNQIVSGFGRGRSGQALGIILDQFPEINELAEGAANAQGQGGRDFEQAINNIGGQLRVFGSSLKDLFTGLAQTGVLDVFVGLLSAAQGLVDVLDFVIDGFNLIPREARTAAFALLEVAGALLLLSKVAPVAALASRVSGIPLVPSITSAQPGGRRGRFSRLFGLGDDAVDAAAAATAAGTAVPGALRLDPTASRTARITATGRGLLAGAGTGIAAGGGALGGALGFTGAGAVTAGLLTGGVGLAVAALGVGVIQAIREAGSVRDQVDQAGQAVFESADQQGFDNARSQIQRARQAVDEQDDFKLLSKDSLTLGAANVVDDLRGGPEAQRAELDRRESELKARRERSEAAAAAAVDRSPGASFAGFAAGPESVAQGLQELTDRGFTAGAQLDALNQAFDALVLKSAEAGNAVGLIFAGQLGEFALQANASLSVGGNDLAKDFRGRGNRLNPFANASNLDQFAGGTVDTLAALGGDALAVLGEGLGFGTGGREFDTPGLLKGIFNEFRSGTDNDREKAKRLGQGGADIERVLADTGTQALLDSSITDVLQERGKDPALGAVAITAEDKKAIADRRREVLLDALGPAFDALPKALQDEFFAAADASFTDTLDGFNGERVTSTNVLAFLGGVRQLAGAKGEEIALATGDQLAGAEATLQEFQSKRQAIVDQIAAADTEGERLGLTRGLALLDQDIARAAVSVVSQRGRRIDGLSRLAIANSGDPITTALLTIQALNDKLAIAVDQDEALGLQTELVTQRRALRTGQAGVVSARERSALNPGDTAGNAAAGVRAAERAISLATPGTAEFYDAVSSLRQAQKSFADAQTEAQVAKLLSGVDPRDTLATAAANLEAVRIRLRAARRGLPGANARTDFDNEGNPVGTVDPQARGFGQGQSFLKGVEAAGFAGKGTQLGFALGNAVVSAGVSAIGRLAAFQTGRTFTGLAEQRADVGAPTSRGTSTDDARDAALAGRGGVPSNATGRRIVSRPNLGEVRTSGALAPKPGTLVGGNNALIDLLLNSGASFDRADGNVVPRRTADGGVSSHSFGNALDIFGTEAELDVIAKQLAPLVGSGGLKELLFTGQSGPGTFLGKNGAFNPSKNVVDNHRDHIHAVVDNPAALGGTGQTAVGADAAAGRIPGVAASPAEVAELERQERQAILDQRQARQDFDVSKIEARTSPNNSLDQARAGLEIANRRLRDQLPGTTGFFQALTAVRAASLALSRAFADRAAAADGAAAARAGSEVARAASQVRIATATLRAQAPRTTEFYNAQAALFEAQRAFAEATRNAASVSLQLGSDITDPVAQASIASRIAERKRREIRKAGGDRAAIEQADLEARTAAVALEQAVFDQRLDRARTDAELGRTSQTTYVNFLKSEEARLGGLANRTVQQQAQYDQVQRELQSLNKQLSGQFNLGDIKIPTPFEVRRSLAATRTEQEARQDALAGSFGGPFKGPGFRSDTTSQVVNVTVNGNDTNAMKAVLSQYLGAAAFQRTSVSNTKIS